MNNKADIWFLFEGIIFCASSLYGYLLYECGSDILSICIISLILVVSSIVNLLIDNKCYKNIISYIYLIYSVLLGIYIALVIILLSNNNMVSIILLLLILINLYISFRYRLDCGGHSDWALGAGKRNDVYFRNKFVNLHLVKQSK